MVELSMGFIKRCQNFETATLRTEKLALIILTTKFGTVVRQNVVQNMKDGFWGSPERQRITICNITIVVDFNPSAAAATFS